MNFTVRPEVPLSDFMLDRGSSTDPSRHPDVDYALYSIPAFDAGKPELVKGREIGSPKKNVQTGDVLLSRIVPHIRRSCIVGSHPESQILASGEWIVFRSKKVHAPYLKHFLISDVFHPRFMGTVAGVGGSLLRANPHQVGDITIPLPPLEEQRQIAAILEKADALRRKRKRALDLYDSLTQSIFLEMFGDGSRFNVIYPLGELSDIVSGITKGRKFNGETARSIGYLAVANVQDKRLDLSTVKTIDATEAEIFRYRLRRDDLLLTEGGDPDKLGRGTLWNDEINEVIHQNHIFRVRVRSDDLLPLYLMWLVGSAYGKSYFLRSAKQTTGIASINKQQLSSFPVPIPPVKLQKSFVDALKKVRLSLSDEVKAGVAADTLFASLQSRAFSGQF